MPPVTHLLDTHSWIWFFNQDPSGREISFNLPDDAQLGVSAFSIWEAAMLEQKKRVRYRPDLETQVQLMLASSFCVLVPLLPEIAIASTRLEAFHSDPADRIIVATALHLGATLITADAKIIVWAQVNGSLVVLPL